MNSFEKYLDVLPEIQQALDENKPVVALESTILSHGMPYPENLDFAHRVEEVIRSLGAIPATCAIVKGRLKVGLTAEELEIIPMGTMEIHAVLHPDHPLARLDRIPLARLGEEKLIMMDAQSKVKELMSREFERHQVIPDILFNYDQVLCMTNLVRSCRYVGIISVAQGQQALGCEGLAIRPFEEPVVFDVGFFLKKGRYLPKLGWELIRFIQENTLRGGT